MSIPLNELKKARNSLSRAPPPKAPLSLPRKKSEEEMDSVPDIAQITSLLPGVKLKKTGIRDSLIAEDVDNRHIGHSNNNINEPENELLNAIKKRRAKFEQSEPVEDVKQAVKPKPKPKPRPRPDHKEKERNLSSSSEDSGKENKEVSADVNKNVLNRETHGEPRLRILPTLERLGRPPRKPAKQEKLGNLLEKYSRADIVIARRRSTLNRSVANSVVIAEDNFEQEDYDDLDELKEEILGRQDKLPMPEEGIFEENYDDVDEIAEKVKEINKKFEEPEESYDDLDTVAEQAQTQMMNEPEESYDDLDTVAEEVQKQLGNGPEESYDDLDAVAEEAQTQLRNDFGAKSGERFGDDFYEAVSSKKEGELTNGDNGFDSPFENKFSSSATPPSSHVKEKGRKDSKKDLEMQKKREREEQKKRKEEEKRREREEKEAKKRKEDEKRKRDREDRDLRKKHKLKPGIEGSGVGEAKGNFAGDGKFELPAKEGETLTIICENGCPPGKWLVKNQEGHLGYVPTELIQLKIDSQGNRVSAVITEDFYEDVDQYQSGGQIKEEPHEPEVYDDIAGQQDDLYEELPADQ